MEATPYFCSTPSIVYEKQKQSLLTTKNIFFLQLQPGDQITEYISHPIKFKITTPICK